ncbi:enoyl-CoA hydratase/isomerase [Xylariales sp. AK1849]|nr:enoyl-CoA hydratase/isomerase [Xylariales sp. AK1849]
MTSPEHPLSYNDYPLPQVKLSHHPPSSPVPTPVIQVLLNRPAQNNAFTDTMVTSLVTAFGLLSTDPRVKCIVFGSADPRNKFFCPGMDLDEAANTSTTPSGSAAPPPPSTAAELARQRAEHRDGGGLVSLAIYYCNKPVVAALNGHGVGVGITVTLPYNLRIASRSARVGFVFARRGISMEACSSFFLPRILGAGRALHLVSTGATYAPDDAAVRDLFAEVVEPDRVVPRALEVAEEIAAKTSGVSLRLMRDMLYRGASTPEEAFALESKAVFDMLRGQDAREGIRSFLEKREPRFEGQWEDEQPAVWPWWEKKDEGGVLGWLKSKI